LNKVAAAAAVTAAAVAAAAVTAETAIAAPFTKDFFFRLNFSTFHVVVCYYLPITTYSTY